MAQDSVGLDPNQARMARTIWGETSEALSQLRHERGELLSRMGPLDAASLSQQLGTLEGTSSIPTMKLLEQAAELSGNAQLQLEVSRSAARRLVWQICSPVNMVRLLCFTWPMSPDFVSCLKALATS